MQTQRGWMPLSLGVVVLSAAILSGIRGTLQLATASEAVRIAQAETVKPGNPKEAKVKAEAHLSVEKLIPGENCNICIRLKIMPGWHINTNPASPEGFLATEVSFKGKRGTKLLDVKYPKGIKLTMDGVDEPLSVYEGSVDLFGKLQVPADAAGMMEDMEIVVRYQACNDRICQAPATVSLKGQLPVAKTGETVKPLNEKLFKGQGS
jgi:uncharacterized protein